MRRPARSVVVLIALAFVANFAVGLALGGSRLIDWLFGSVLSSAVLLVGRTSWLAFRDASRQRRTAAGLEAVDPRAVARQAAIEERRRLSRDIEVCVRDYLVSIRATAAGVEDTGSDPRPALQRIGAEAARAMTDLRRQLGLLRAEEDGSPTESSAAVEPQQLLSRGDWLLTGAVMLLSVVEMKVLVPMEGLELTLPAIVFSMATAVTVLGRRVAPEAASIACAVILLVSALVKQPALDGFWLALTVGLLAWSCASLATRRAWIVTVFLGVAGLVSRLLNHPENAPLFMALYVVVVLGGSTVGRHRRRQSLARERTNAREGELRAVADEAVGAERRSMARELHDVVSHAVSVIAVQAGAGELSWPTNPATARRAVNVIRTTAEQTLNELYRLKPGDTPNPHDEADIRALADRMRAAGLSITLTLSIEPGWPVPGTVYRIVQETLTNALRHAPGSAVGVLIDRGDDYITVQVADDGPGASGETRRGFGLVGLTERIRQAGGTLVTRSAPEVRGFEVTAILPVEKAVGAT